MIRLLPRPGLLTGLVVSVSVASGVMFGVVAVGAALAVHAVAGRVGRRT